MDIYEFCQSDSIGQFAKPKKRNINNIAAQFLDYQVKLLTIRYPFLTKNQIKGKARETWKRQSREITKYERITRLRSNLPISETENVSIMDKSYQQCALFQEPMDFCGSSHSVSANSRSRINKNKNTLSQQTLGILRKNGKSRNCKEFKVTFMDDKENIIDDVSEETSELYLEPNSEEQTGLSISSISRSYGKDNAEGTLFNCSNQKNVRRISKCKETIPNNKVDKCLDSSLKFSNTCSNDSCLDSESEFSVFQKRLDFECEESLNNIEESACIFDVEKNDGLSPLATLSFERSSADSKISDRHSNAGNNCRKEYTEKTLPICINETASVSGSKEVKIDNQNNSLVRSKDERNLLYNISSTGCSSFPLEKEVNENEKTETRNAFASPKQSNLERLDKNKPGSKNATFGKKKTPAKEQFSPPSFKLLQSPLSCDTIEGVKKKNLFSIRSNKSLPLPTNRSEIRLKSPDKSSFEKSHSSSASEEKIEHMRHPDSSEESNNGVFQTNLRNSLTKCFTVTNKCNSEFPKENSLARSKIDNDSRNKRSCIESDRDLFSISISPIKGPNIYRQGLAAHETSTDLSENVTNDESFNLSYITTSSKDKSDSGRLVEDIIESMRKIGSTMEISDLSFSSCYEAETNALIDDDLGDVEKFELKALNEETKMELCSENSKSLNESCRSKKYLRNGSSRKQNVSGKQSTTKSKTNKRTNKNTIKKQHNRSKKNLQSSKDKELITISTVSINPDANNDLTDQNTDVEETFFTEDTNTETKSLKLNISDIEHIKHNPWSFQDEENSIEKDMLEVSSVDDDILLLLSEDEIMSKSLSSKSVTSIDTVSNICTDYTIGFDTPEETPDIDQSSENSPYKTTPFSAKTNNASNIVTRSKKVRKNSSLKNPLKQDIDNNTISTVEKLPRISKECLENANNKNALRSTTNTSENISPKFKIACMPQRRQYLNYPESNLDLCDVFTQNRSTPISKDLTLGKNVPQNSIPVHADLLDNDVFSISSDEEFFRSSTKKNEPLEIASSAGYGLLCELFGN